MNHDDIKKFHEFQSAEAVMKWYGWGSPIGLCIFFWTIVGIIVVIKIVFFG